MNKSNRIVYLPIRALGDFIITASVIKNLNINKIPIMLPDYLTDLFFAIEGEKYFEVIGNIHFNNQPAFFELYKVKDINNIKRLITDSFKIGSTLNKKDTYLVDYSSRRLFFVMANMIWPSKKENMYEGRLKILQNKKLINSISSESSNNTIRLSKVQKIVIIPDSRIKEKSISTKLINEIINHFKNYQFHIAHFSHNKTIDNDRAIEYSNFDELINIINIYDLIISAESLPYHLANFMGKQHFVIYNKSRHFKTSFMTPFMIKNNYYSIFEGNNSEIIIRDLNKVLCQS